MAGWGEDFEDILPERDQITEAANAKGIEVGDENATTEDELLNPDISKTIRAVVRTSDRILFRRCRRRWGWQSHLRYNLGPIRKAAPLWLGSGVHFALEDFHSVRLYPTAADAFRAYVQATLKQSRGMNLPEDLDESIELGVGMMDYYELWLQARDPLETYVHEGKPQVEVNFKLTLPWEVGKYGIDEVVYSGQIDRVVIDESGFLWIVEYKTAKAISTTHYQTDSQITSYCWAASCIYDRPIGGVIYQQHRKTLPKEPRILANGTISTAANQITSHRAYREVLGRVYGDVSRAPNANVRYLNELASLEQPRHDPFIRRDYIYRNEYSIQAEGQKIMMEIDEMLNPELGLYPNPTRNCAFDCPFLSPCVSLDDGGDFEYELEQSTISRELEYDSWRKYLVQPQHQQLLLDSQSSSSPTL